MSRISKLNQFISEGYAGSRTTIGEVKLYIFDMGSDIYVDIYRAPRINCWRNYQSLKRALEKVCRD